MSTLVCAPRDVERYLFQSFHYQSDLLPQHMPEQTPVESSTRYRDAAVWRLLCLEKDVDANDLAMYWEIMDTMMDISIEVAITLLQNLYEYRVRKLRPLEKRQIYPGVSNDLYRLEYNDDRGGYRDVCAGILLHEAIDLLQAEAERLVRR